MKVQTVTVEIHEKRNHPNEYGHYDSRVSYTVEVEQDEDAAKTVEWLQFQARQQVAIECDRWIAEIERDGQIKTARINLSWIINRAKDNNIWSDDPKDFKENLQILPVEQQGQWRDKLEAAKQECISSFKKRLDEDIKDAERGHLTRRGQSLFFQVLENLPEAEQHPYHQRMAAAFAPKPASNALGINDDSMAAERAKYLADQKDEIPYDA